jgi:hypothetical protein
VPLRHNFAGALIGETYLILPYAVLGTMPDAGRRAASASGRHGSAAVGSIMGERRPSDGRFQLIVTDDGGGDLEAARGHGAAAGFARRVGLFGPRQLPDGPPRDGRLPAGPLRSVGA